MFSCTPPQAPDASPYNPFIFTAGTKKKSAPETVSQSTFKKNGSYAFIIDFPNTQNYEEIELSIHGDTNQGNRYLDILQMKGDDGFQLILARFSLPADANTDHDISAVAQDGLLIVTVKRLEPKVSKVIKFTSCSCGCN
ncbi:hypothetical protein MKW92_013817 [Papaver armeniacum]|nr:hypothetical protein MKW92_013817 [Papaver armeniacum]